MNENFEGHVSPQEAGVKIETINRLNKKRLSIEETAKIIRQIEGLENTLFNWVDRESDHVYEDGYTEKQEPSLSFDQVVILMADNKEAREAVKSFLGRGGAGWDRDMDMADTKMDELIWALVDEFEKRCNDKK